MTLTRPPHQRAWTYRTWGLPRQILTFDEHFDVPEPPPKSELLIRVSHASLNPGAYITMNITPPFIRRYLSGGKTVYVPEGEFAGVVHLAGPAAPAHLQPGTRVFGSLPVAELYSGKGTLAEYIRMPAQNVAVVPPSMSWEDAASLSGAGLTASCMLDAANITPGTCVFVNGASGGVGTMVVQLAKERGAYVVATCSARTESLVKDLGADEVVDYRANAPLSGYLAMKGYHFQYIFDTVGTQALFQGCAAYMDPSGVYVNAGNFEGFWRTIGNIVKNMYLPRLFGGVPRRYIMVATTPNGEKAAALAQLLVEGKIRVVVDEVFAFEDAMKAYDRLVAKDVTGKLVIKVQDI